VGGRFGDEPPALFVAFCRECDFEEVFEGYLPARRLPGDYFELNTLGTAMAGRRGGGTFRLGDPITVRVEEIRRWEGKVEPSLDAERAGDRRAGFRKARSASR
jgi:exoribonuclease R